MDIEASEAECEALALRFNLKALSNLQANLALRPANYDRGSASSNIYVEGKVSANVSQICVRTNEVFTADLEFPLECLVQPMSPLSAAQLYGRNNEIEEEQKRPNKSSSSSQRKKAKTIHKKSVDEMDLLELQRLLQEDDMIQSTDLFFGEGGSLDDNILQDVSVYPSGGMLDVGELVAQLFYLQLDPYPKKPGTDLFHASISG